MSEEAHADRYSYLEREHSRGIPDVIDLTAEHFVDGGVDECRLRALARLRAAASVLFELADQAEAAQPALAELLALPQRPGIDARTIERSLGWVRAEIEDAADCLLGRMVSLPA